MWMETERTALVETLRSADPDSPTLCDGWTVRHLLAHLLQREHAPLRNALDMIAKREPGSERFLSRLVAEARSPAGYAALLDRFAAGPSRRNPMGWVGDSVYLLEYIIHHEDVRRAGTDPAPPRNLPLEERRAIWQRLMSGAKLAYRRSPVGVVLAVPGGPRKLVRKGPAPIVVTGDPVELALHAFGREDAAAVTITEQSAR